MLRRKENLNHPTPSLYRTDSAQLFAPAQIPHSDKTPHSSAQIFLLFHARKCNIKLAIID